MRFHCLWLSLTGCTRSLWIVCLSLSCVVDFFFMILLLSINLIFVFKKMKKKHTKIYKDIVYFLFLLHLLCVLFRFMVFFVCRVYILVVVHIYRFVRLLWWRVVFYSLYSVWFFLFSLCFLIPFRSSRIEFSHISNHKLNWIYKKINNNIIWCWRADNNTSHITHRQQQQHTHEHMYRTHTQSLPLLCCCCCCYCWWVSFASIECTIKFNNYLPTYTHTRIHTRRRIVSLFFCCSVPLAQPFHLSVAFSFPDRLFVLIQQLGTLRCVVLFMSGTRRKTARACVKRRRADTKTTNNHIQIT